MDAATTAPRPTRRVPARPRRPAARAAAPAGELPCITRGSAVALVMALQPQSPGRPFHAAVVTAQGEQWEFHSLPELVRYVVSLSVHPPPPDGLR